MTISSELLNKRYIQHIHDNRVHFVCCKLCNKYPDIVKRFTYRNRLPEIVTKEGARYRSIVLENHLKQDFHKECVKADRMKSLDFSTSVRAPMDISMTKANQIQADYVGKLLIQIFTDAKRLTLSAWNWPIRYVASLASHAFSIQNENHETIPKNLSLQYINNKAHLRFMSCIVESDVSVLKTKIENCLALSLRIDGSIDRTQIDKIYVLGKIITSTGKSELIF